MRDLLPGSRTLDSVPDEDDGEEDSKPEKRVKSTVGIIGLFAGLLLVEWVLFESLIQPLAVTVYPGFAGEPVYDSASMYGGTGNSAAWLEVLSTTVTGLLMMGTSIALTDKLLGDRLAEE